MSLKDDTSLVKVQFQNVKIETSNTSFHIYNKLWNGTIRDVSNGSCQSLDETLV